MSCAFPTLSEWPLIPFTKRWSAPALTALLLNIRAIWPALKLASMRCPFTALSSGPLSMSAKSNQAVIASVVALDRGSRFPVPKGSVFDFLSQGLLLVEVRDEVEVLLVA